MLRKVFQSLCALALLVGLMVATGLAQPADKRTLFTFSSPIALPGVTLPAGQYLFRLAAPDGDRKVVQVLSGDGKTPYGMFFSLPAERVEAASTPEVRFMETAAGMPAAVKTWWYPNERTGYEFIFPREQARRLAQGAREPVLTTQAQTTTTAQTNTGDLARISSTGQDTSVGSTTATAIPPAGRNQRGEIASSSISVRNDTRSGADARENASGTQAFQRTRTALPQTAGRMPLVAVVGLGALFVGVGLRIQGRRQSRA